MSGGGIQECHRRCPRSVSWVAQLRQRYTIHHGEGYFEASRQWTAQIDSPEIVLDEGADGHIGVHDAGDGGSPRLRVQNHLQPANASTSADSCMFRGFEALAAVTHDAHVAIRTAIRRQHDSKQMVKPHLTGTCAGGRTHQNLVHVADLSAQQHSST